MWFDLLFFKSLHEEKNHICGREEGIAIIKIEEKQEGGGQF